MKRLLPDSLIGRTVLVLLVGLTVSHMASVAMFYSDRANTVFRLDSGHVAHRVAMISRMIASAPPPERARFAQAMSGPGLHIQWDRRALVEEGADTGWRTALIAEALQDDLGELGHRELRLHYAARSAAERPRTELPEPLAPGPPAQPMVPDMHGGMHGNMQGPAGHMSGPMHMRGPMHGGLMGRDNVHVSLQLPDQTWLNFVAPFEAAPPFWSLRFALSVSLMVLAITAFSIWVARRLTAPLRGFAHAAERLGVDVHAPPLPELGTREVRQATRAFNQMQQRIRRFIDDRTQMFAAISHDLRTPITRLRLRAEFVGDPAQQAKMLADLDEMEAMISSTLSFARDEAGDEPRETVDLVALVARVCDDLADTGRAVTFRGEGRLPYSCRPIALRRAFTNLIENGANYGTRARVSLSAREGGVLVQIDDDGPGIPENQMENLFKPFFRLEGSRSRETGGTGLGLTVAKTVIRAHGGDIAIHNRPEGGLRVEVVLPR